MSGRRSLLSGLTAAVMLPAIAPLATAVVLEPDAVLLKLCGEFCRVCDQHCRIWEGSDFLSDDAADAAAKPLLAKLKGLADAITQHRAKTSAGVVAVAQALERYAGHGGFSFDYPDAINGKLLWAIMRDAAALSGTTTFPAFAQGIPVMAIPSVVPHPDAELIAACREFCLHERAAQAVMNALGDVGFDDPTYLAAEDEVDGRREPQTALMDRICTTPATTPEGVAAVATAALAWDGPAVDVGIDCRGHLWGDRLQRALWRGALAGGVAA